MRFELLSLAALTATAQAALPSGVKIPNTSGFQNPVVHISNGGSAVCVTGNVPVYAKSTKNLALNFSIPANQSEVTQTWLEYATSGSPFLDQVSNGTYATVSGTYNISSTLCMPSNGTTSSTVQFLTHGIGFTGSYWDFAPGYSYVDAAAAAGYSTFFYDRLGTGASSHPDPIQVVQGPLEVVIANNLIALLRNGTFASTTFTHVVGTGHSFGSEITEAVTANYPTSLDLAVLTGFSVNTSAVDAFTLSLNLAIASLDAPYRFSSLNNAYLVASTPISIQTGFFRSPGFDPSILSLAYATQGTVTFGEYFSMSSLTSVASNFTGPVTVVNGNEDLPFCFGNCSYPTDQAEAAIKELYPKTEKSGSLLLKHTGHGVNLHYSAGEAYTFIQEFVKEAGL